MLQLPKDCFQVPIEEFRKQKSAYEKLVKCGYVRKWKLELDSSSSPFEIKRDEVLPGTRTDIFIQLLPGGGVKGFEPLYSQATEIGFGDIYGEWSTEGIYFYILKRCGRGPKLAKCEGKWSKVGEYEKITEGKYSIIFGEKLPLSFSMTEAVKEDTKVLEDESHRNIGDFAQRIRNHISTTPEQQHFYDFEIECKDGGLIKCHKIILVSHSKYFEGFFRKENEDTSSVKLNFSVDSIKPCIQFLYTREISIDGENVQELLIAASYLMIPDITSKAINYILMNVDSTNCLDVLSFADTYGIADILDEVTEIISTNFEAIMDKNEVLEVFPMHIFKALIQKNLIIKNKNSGVIIPDKERKEMLKEFAKKYCDIRKFDPSVTESLLRMIKSTEEKRVFKFMTQCYVPHVAEEEREVLRETFSFSGEGSKFIKKLQIASRKIGEKDYISGLVIAWTDGTDSNIGDGDDIVTYEVPHGEHITGVYSYCTDYTKNKVSNIVFILSNGMTLGNLDGERHFLNEGLCENSLIGMPFGNHCFNTYLDGIKGEIVLLQNQGVPVLNKIRFQYGYVNDLDESVVTHCEYFSGSIFTDK